MDIDNLYEQSKKQARENRGYHEREDIIDYNPAKALAPLATTVSTTLVKTCLVCSTVFTSKVAHRTHCSLVCLTAKRYDADGNDLKEQAND